MTSRLAVAAALAFALSTGGAFAQAAAPATPAMAPAAPMMKKTEKPRTAQSLECSKKADAQNIHGKPRKSFMSKCKSGKA